MNMPVMNIDTIFAILMLIVGLGMLVGGGGVLIPNTVKLATKLRIPARIIGFILIAGGTSAPELIVSIDAAIHHSPGIVWGNVLGSNIANSLIVLGLAAMIFPVASHAHGLKMDSLMVALMSSFVALCFLQGGLIGWTGKAISIGLMSAFLGYNIYLIRSGRNEDSKNEEGEHGGEIETETDDNFVQALLWVLVSIGLLIWGADLVVKAGIDLARLMGWQEAVIGLTVIAFGTTLPEIIAVLASLYHKRSDIALGNILGSNLFNLTMVLGAGGASRGFACCGRNLTPAPQHTCPCHLSDLWLCGCKTPSLSWHWYSPHHPLYRLYYTTNKRAYSIVLHIFNI